MPAVHPALVDPGGPQCQRPVAKPERLQFDPPAVLRWEEHRQVDPSRHRVHYLKHLRPERHAPPLTVALHARLEPPARVDALDLQHAVLPVHVATIEPEELFRAHAGFHEAPPGSPGRSG